MENIIFKKRIDDVRDFAVSQDKKFYNKLSKEILESKLELLDGINENRYKMEHMERKLDRNIKDTQELKSDVTILKQDVAVLKKDVADLKVRVESIENKVDKVNDNLESLKSLLIDALKR